MEKFDPSEFFKEMQGVLKEFQGRLIKEVDEKIEVLRKETLKKEPTVAPPSVSAFIPALGLMKREIYSFRWQGKQYGALITEQETREFSQALFNLMHKYRFDTLEATKIKDK